MKNMKKIIIPCICIMLVITTAPLVVSEENENIFNKTDFKFDVRPLFLLQNLNPLWQIIFKHLDIVSFSISEDPDEPEFLHANMKIRDFRYSELRSCYVIYFTYNHVDYYIATITHTKGKYVSFKSGYFNHDGTGDYTQIDGEINEEENEITWKVPKENIGNPKMGDEFVDIHANTLLILQKDCYAKFPIHLVKDTAKPLLETGYTYTVQC